MLMYIFPITEYMNSDAVIWIYTTREKNNAKQIFIGYARRR